MTEREALQKLRKITTQDMYGGDDGCPFHYIYNPYERELKCLEKAVQGLEVLRKPQIRKLLLESLSVSKGELTVAEMRALNAIIN